MDLKYNKNGAFTGGIVEKRRMGLAIVWNFLDPSLDCFFPNGDVQARQNASFIHIILKIPNNMYKNGDFMREKE